MIFIWFVFHLLDLALFQLFVLYFLFANIYTDQFDENLAIWKNVKILNGK